MARTPSKVLPVAALAALLAAAGCRTVEEGLDEGVEIISEALLPTSQERRLGDQLATQVESEEKLERDAAVQRYVQQIGQRIVRATKGLPEERRGIRYEFQVIDRPDQINAFALPGGHIYVYSGLIEAAESEAELAAVLAHEVGHVTNRHSAEQLVKALGIQAVGSLALGSDPGMIQALAAGIAAQGYMAKNSRDDEREADRRGLVYLIRAGYDPFAMSRFFARLDRMQQSAPNALTDFFASHPDPGDRVRSTRIAIQQQKAAGKGKQELVGDFDRIQARLEGGVPTGRAAERRRDRREAGKARETPPRPAPRPVEPGQVTPVPQK